MNKDKVQQIIKEVALLLPKIESQVSNINNGGCGVFAYLMWKRLLELGVETVKAWPIIYDDSTPDEVNTAFLNISEGDDPLNIKCNFTHIVLEVELPDGSARYLIDSEGIDEVPYVTDGMQVEGHFVDDLEPDASRFGESLTYDLLRKLALDTRQGLWDPEFDREDIPTIEYMLKRIQPV